MSRVKKFLPLLAAALFLLIQPAIVGATYREIYLNKTDAMSKAHGYITIKPIGVVPTDRILHVNVYSLLPGTLYDVWIVERGTGKRMPAGFGGENTFRTNAGGAGHFIYWTSEFVLGWNKLEVSSHMADDKRGDVKVILWAWMYQ